MGKINKLGSFKSLHRKKASSQKIEVMNTVQNFPACHHFFSQIFFTKSTPVALSVDMKTGLLNLLCSF